MDINKLKVLAESLKGWQHINKHWEDEHPDEPGVALVGAIDEDDNEYPVATINCGQYDVPEDSIKLAEFYATVNPKTVLELIARIEALEAAK